MSDNAWKVMCSTCANNTSSLAAHCAFGWAECEVYGNTRRKMMRLGGDPYTICTSYKEKERR